MTTNQEGRQSGFRTLASVSSGSFNQNALQAFAAEGITVTGKSFNEAFILWLQQKTGSSATEVNGLMTLYAQQQGFTDWDSMNTVNSSSFLNPYSPVCQLDVSSSNSYPGTGQTWANIINMPADGSAKTDYDFFLGATGSVTTDDPTFNGVAGGHSINEFWSFDGGDWFKFKKASNTTFLNSLHKNNANFTIIAWIKTDSSAVGSPSLFGTADSTTGEVGTIFGWNISGQLALQIRGDAGASVLNALSNSSSITTNTIYMIAVSLDEAAGAGGSFFYINGTGQTAFDGTYNTPSTNDAPYTPGLAARGNGSNKIVSSNAHLMQFSIHSDALSKTQLDAIYNHYKGRYGL